ncbi:hypothetical protein [Spirosoma sp.]|uniref:hypothetical protein n=1 Tax=Spirosoma sp. TaxID=1899569 RepID=UPI0026046E0F|nr:hypothetical protein [Spirosoma sp.]MCX6215279.1 hypothetical protein [Spirosoma sp.]
MITAMNLMMGLMIADSEQKRIGSAAPDDFRTKGLLYTMVLNSPVLSYVLIHNEAERIISATPPAPVVTSVASTAPVATTAPAATSGTSAPVNPTPAGLAANLFQQLIDTDELKNYVESLQSKKIELDGEVEHLKSKYRAAKKKMPGELTDLLKKKERIDLILTQSNLDLLRKLVNTSDLQALDTGSQNLLIALMAFSPDWLRQLDELLAEVQCLMGLPSPFFSDFTDQEMQAD